jgi:hypothetical protein
MPPNAPCFFDLEKRTHREPADGRHVQKGAGMCGDVRREREFEKRTQREPADGRHVQKGTGMCGDVRREREIEKRTQRQATIR